MPEPTKVSGSRRSSTSQGRAKQTRTDAGRTPGATTAEVATLTKS
jgi:hypothetical protein